MGEGGGGNCQRIRVEQEGYTESRGIGHGQGRGEESGRRETDPADEEHPKSCKLLWSPGHNKPNEVSFCKSSKKALSKKAGELRVKLPDLICK